MAQKISSGNVFGRIGQHFGNSLAEQFPKEMERGRLAAGLEQINQQGSKLTPFQQLSQLATLPGVTPQLIQSGADLLRYQSQAKALQDFQKKEEEPRPFPGTPPDKSLETPGSARPTTTEPGNLEAALRGYIPKTQQQLNERARELYTVNPSFYQKKPENALAAAIEEDARNQKIAESYQTLHDKQQQIQDNVVQRLRTHSDKLKVAVPERLYSKIEDEAIEAITPKSKGGGGLTEQQAVKQFGEKLDDLSRDYSAITTLGNWGITGRPSKNTLATMNALQKSFDKIGATEDLADLYISDNKLSPKFAYALAEPVSNTPEINKELSKLPSMSGLKGIPKGYKNRENKELGLFEFAQDETEKFVKKAASFITKKTSPLAVAYEMEKKGLDPNIWINYLSKNREKLGLTNAQIRQLEKPNNLVGTINDWWLSSYSGVE